MTTWPDTRSIYRRNAEYLIAQTTNDDWDYDTGAEAGYTIEESESSTMNIPVPVPAISVFNSSVPSMKDQKTTEIQHASRTSTPAGEKAALLKAKLLAKRSLSNTRTADSTPKPAIGMPPVTRQDSNPAIDALIQAVVEQAKPGQQMQTSTTMDQNAATTGGQIQELLSKGDNMPTDDKIPEVQAAIVSPTLSNASKDPVETAVKPKRKKQKTTTVDSIVRTKNSKDPTLDISNVANQTSRPAIQAVATQIATKTSATATNQNVDIADWLEFTGFYNLEHRQKLLTLHRRRRSIQRELAELESEINVVANVAPAIPTTPIPTPSTAVKRARSPDATVGASRQQLGKVRRVVSTQVSGVDVKRSEVPQEPVTRGRARTRSPITRPTNGYSGNGKFDRTHHAIRDRDRLSRSPLREGKRDTRMSLSKTWINPATSTSRTIGNGNYQPLPPRINYDNGAVGLELHNGNCRYFMVKSWNWDNVLQAQKDGLWVTQEQNESLYRDAYLACRHVIFFFSVNNSKAFQGYARMDCLPGNAPQPSWASSLKWPVSKAYRLRWIKIAETKFRDTSDLKNSLNENMPVLVGRDGQEIEEQCAISLAEIIDEDGKRQRQVGWY